MMKRPLRNHRSPSRNHRRPPLLQRGSSARTRARCGALSSASHALLLLLAWAAVLSAPPAALGQEAVGEAVGVGARAGAGAKFAAADDSMQGPGEGGEAAAAEEEEEEGVRGTGSFRGTGGERAPKVPFCRASADVATLWMPIWDPDAQLAGRARRVVVSGGKGVDYFSRRADGQLSYLSDMWALHITNTGFIWDKVAPIGRLHPSPRWQTGDTVAYGSSLVVYGGDDQTTNQVGGLGDLWVYTPPGTSSHLHDTGEYVEGSASNKNDWREFKRGGMHPGERREPSLAMINSTLLLQGGKVEDGESIERCDSRFFLVDLGDPNGIWREGPSFPGECGLGQTMNTVNITHMDAHGAEETETLAVVFGGCKWNFDGNFVCSNDLYAYSLKNNSWAMIIPKSDAYAAACEVDNRESHGYPSRSPAAVNGPNDTPLGATSPSSSSSLFTTGSGIDSSTTGDSTSDGGSDGGINSGGGDEGAETETKGKKGKRGKKSKKAVCPGASTPRPLGRHAHATAYIESAADGVNALFVFGGRENADDLAPLGDLWMFDLKKMTWSEIEPGSKQRTPANRFSHSLTVWQGGAGDGVASLVVFGGQTITRKGLTAYMNDVWLYTPHTGQWREVSVSDCKEGASGKANGGSWTAVFALVFLLVFVVVAQCVLHYACPTYQPPMRRKRRRKRATSSSALNESSSGRGQEEEEENNGRPTRGKSEASLVTKGLLTSSNSEKASYQTMTAE